MDSMELLHATAEDDGSWRLVVAVPSAQSGDDPSYPGEAQFRMVVLLAFGAAFQGRVQRGQRVDLQSGEHVRGRHCLGTVAPLRQLDLDAGRFGRGGASFTSRSAVATPLSSSCSPCDFITRNNCSITRRCLLVSIK